MKNIFLLILTIATVACVGVHKPPVTTEGGQMVALSDSIIENRRADTISFGRMRAGEKAVREILFVNDGDKPLVITQLDLSCGCVGADYPRQPLMPGEQAPATLTLDTRDLDGWVFKTVGVRTSLGSRSYTLCITAEVE